MNKDLSRRKFLASAGAVASITMLGQSLFDPEAAFAASFVRRDVGGMTANDPIIQSYAEAIKAMKALPSSNPLSWAYQAAIHGTVTMPPQTAWNTCEHGTYFFWSWHRMYLYWFERIIRKLSCNPCWALPYWNYTSPNQRQLPAVFRDTASELFVSNRSTAMNNGSGSLPASYVDYSGGFSLLNFVNASSSIEGTPHAAVHVAIGGWMGSVATAAQDPIFWLHHCNIDRLWNLWLAQGGGRSNPLGDATWKSTKFTFFDENGNQLQMTSCDVLRAAQQLNYVYEGEPAQVTQYCERFRRPFLFERIILLKLDKPIILGPEPVSIDLNVKDLRSRLSTIVESKTEAVLIEFEDVVAERPPGVVWEVYVGMPEKPQPDSKDSNFVGTIALFGSGIRSESHEKFTPARFTFALDSALKTFLKTNKESLTVSFVPKGVLIDDKQSSPKVESQVRIGTVSLTTETAKEMEKES